MKQATKWIIATLTVVAVGSLLAVFYLLWDRSTDDEPVTMNSFEDCVAAGNPAAESHPRQCTDAATGKSFTEELNEGGVDSGQELQTRQYESVRGTTITIDDWADGRMVDGNLTITGMVPGSWSFEGSFPVAVVMQGDIGLPGGTAQLSGDWMTTEQVPFSVTLDLSGAELAGEKLDIVLQKANPSDLPENDDSLRLPVVVAE